MPDVIRNQHQGLFIRASVKNVLAFLREQDASEYIQVLRQLLFTKLGNGKPAYRYHIQSLVLSTMVYFETPLPQEINLISKEIFDDDTFMDVILNQSIMWSGLTQYGQFLRVEEDGKSSVMIIKRKL